MRLFTTQALIDHVFGFLPPEKRPRPQSVRKMRVTGKGLLGGLPYVKIGTRAYYREADVAAFIAALPAKTSTAGGENAR